MRVNPRLFKNAFKSRFLKSPAPMILSWEIISKCNYHCSYCGFGDPEFSKKFKQLTVDEVLDVIDLFNSKDVGAVSLTGGEPLLFKGLEKVIAKMKSHGWTVKLGTNGSLIEERFDLIKNIDQAAVSLDGPEVYNDAVRGAGTFSKTMGGIKKLRQEGIPYYLNVTVSSANVNSMDEIIEIAKTLKARCFFQPATENVLFKDDKNPFSCQIKDFHSSIDKLIEVKKMNDSIVMNSIKGLEYLKNWPKPTAIPCYSGINTFRIDSESNMWNCGRNKKDFVNLLQLSKEGNSLSFPKFNPCDECWCAGLIEHNYFMENPFSNFSEIRRRINI